MFLPFHFSLRLIYTLVCHLFVKTFPHFGLYLSLCSPFMCCFCSSYSFPLLSLSLSLYSSHPLSRSLSICSACSFSLSLSLSFLHLPRVRFAVKFVLAVSSLLVHGVRPHECFKTRDVENMSFFTNIRSREISPGSLSLSKNCMPLNQSDWRRNVHREAARTLVSQFFDPRDQRLKSCDIQQSWIR